MVPLISMFESGDLPSGWVASGNAGFSTNLYGIVPFSGSNFGYVMVAAIDECKLLKETLLMVIPEPECMGWLDLLMQVILPGPKKKFLFSKASLLLK